MYTIPGHHHLSMITKDAKENSYFYKHILGLRRVKITVNQDDPSMYHLFYGDNVGSPGTEMTFFEMPYVGNTYRGTNAITRIGLVVSSLDSLRYWKERLSDFAVKSGKITTYAGRPAVHFDDMDGLHLVLLTVENAFLSFWEPWEDAEVPAEHQIKGIGPVEIKVRRPRKLAHTLTELLHYSKGNSMEDGVIFTSDNGNVFSEIIMKEKGGEQEKPGRGSIHHIALRARDLDELRYWEKQIEQTAFFSTGIIDRYYFHSLYFRESNGILFEIATDGPGFTVDQPVEELGETLRLPPFLEEKRTEIEQALTPLEE